MRWLGSALSICIFASWSSILVILCLRMFGVYFMPASDSLWVQSTPLPALFGCALVAGYIPVMLNDPDRRARLPKTDHGRKGVFIGLLLITGLSMDITVKFLIPAAHAAIRQEDAALQYLVTNARATPTSRSGCPRAVRVELPVLVFSNLCRVPQTLRASLRAGETIVAHGTGSAQGVFYGRFSMAQ